jgi:hypothetical protein
MKGCEAYTALCARGTKASFRAEEVTAAGASAARSFSTTQCGTAPSHAATAAL